MPEDAAPTNAPEWSVSDLAQALKRTVEEAYGHVRVRGEITGYRGPAASGHAYFGLKDEGAKIEAVIWKGTFGRLRFKPEEGIEVIAHGRLTTFPGKSSYQIVIDRLEPAGVGALMALLEDRRRRLAAEGLFDADRKVAIPHLPRVIGVVTSPTGAVIRDILHRLADRFPRQVVVWPVRVQGDSSAAEIAAAIDGFDALVPGGPIARPDVIIIARGGGSLEDLWSFNEEIVVRAAAACSIPLVSAVGHETDWTLLDHVADRRAPTPTGAAEMVVPVRADLVATVADLGGRLAGSSLRLIERRRSDLRNLARGLPGLDALFAGPRQRLDLAAGRLTQALILNVRRHQQQLEGKARRLAARNPSAALDRGRDRIESLGARLAAAAAGSLARRRETFASTSARLAPHLLARRASLGRDRLGGLLARFAAAALARTIRRRDELVRLSTLLDAYSYQGVLQRGFALVRDGGGHPVRDAETAGRAASLELQFADGRLRVRPEGGPPRGGRARPVQARQGSLFDE